VEADEIVFVPKKYLIYNKKINNFKDYKKLIKAYNYFLLELSDEIINFQKNPENKYDVLKFLIKNRDSAFFREQLDIFEEPILKTQINYNLHVVNFREIYFSSDYIFEKGNLKININNIKI